MASSPNLDDDDDFGGDYAGNITRNKRPRPLDDDEDFKEHVEEEHAPGAATGIVLILRDSLKKSEEDCKVYQDKCKQAEDELEKWRSVFQNESFIPTGTCPEPGIVVTAVQNLRSSEESLKEQLEKARKKEAAFIVNFAKREQEITELKAAVRDLKSQLKLPSLKARRLLLDPAIHEEFTRLKSAAEEKDKKIKELEENLAAVNFTTQSRMGKLLMAKCRTLQEENDEIGMMASEGKIHELGMKLKLQKNQNFELRRQIQELLDYMEMLEEGVNKSNELVNTMKKQLEDKDIEAKKMTEGKKPKSGGKEDKKTSEGGNAVDASKANR
ncbi:FKBP12-interacting protein of 37 kDa isoform X2 [Cryptomeria japonica]|uniref:FKBP12-interacting protein of 37 kDa isoform X2 n=1 Tax=Cryptomeria japonica TaxID=3369 RepID=UPI0027DA55C6|nr:FKBP12-interacting protein of 37 kDa isoform X2 [Cryptomeria japonica]